MEKLRLALTSPVRPSIRRIGSTRLAILAVALVTVFSLGICTRAIPDDYVESPRQCVPGIATGVVQRTESGDLVTCRWLTRAPTCSYHEASCGASSGHPLFDTMPGLSSMCEASNAFREWFPRTEIEALPGQRGFLSPHDFLRGHALDLRRDVRAAVLIDLFPRGLAWNRRTLWTHTDEELLWWVGTTHKVWWHALDDDVVVFGRVDSDYRVVWDRRTDRVYAPAF